MIHLAVGASLFGVLSASPARVDWNDECENGAFYPHEDKCDSYYHCTQGQLEQFWCAERLYFDENRQNCNYKENVDCCDGKRPCPPDTTEDPLTTQPPVTTEEAATTEVPEGPADPKIVCYYTNWSQYRSGGGKFYPEDIDPTLCTHLVFAFAKIEQTSSGWGLAPYEWNDLSEEWMVGMYERFNKLKEQNSDLKTILAVGGWNHGSGPFTSMVSTDAGIQQFSRNSIEYLRQHGFDGLDLDWEYPAKETVDVSPQGDYERFKRLTEQIRYSFNTESLSEGSERLLLTAAVGIGRDKIYEWEGKVPSYDVVHLSNHMDIISLMAYDMHGHWEDKTGHHAMLYANPDDDRLNKTTNVEWVVENWLELGADPSKITLGMGAYGRSFALLNNDEHGFMAPCKGSWTGLYSGAAGPYTREPGYLAYYEICEKLNAGSLTEVYDDRMEIPYAYGNDLWVGYDNIHSLELKVDFAKHHGLGGIMFWAIDIDDFSGNFCNMGKYPLINASRNRLMGYVPPPTQETSTAEPMPTTSNPTTQTSDNGGNGGNGGNGCDGLSDGAHFPDSEHCDIYYLCLWGEPQTNTCATGLYWNTEINACDWTYNVDCCDGQRPC